MNLVLGFVLISFISFSLVCLYTGVKSCYEKIKKDGFLKFLEVSFYVFVAVAVVTLLSLRVTGSLFPQPQFEGVHKVKYERTNSI